LLIASDGVWEFITNEDAIEIISKHILTGNIEKACDELLEESLKRWKEEEETIDDITFVLVIFENKKVKYTKKVKHEFEEI